VERLPEPLGSFRDLIEADLRRAARLIVKVQDELDPQLRVATPTGDWAIAVTLPADEYGRRSVLRAIGTFMAWKEALGFTWAGEVTEPKDALFCCGVTRAERHICMTRIARLPRPWTAANFSSPQWLPASSIDPLIVGLLPDGPRALTPKEVAAMVTWFGKDGKFPAINMATGEIGA